MPYFFLKLYTLVYGYVWVYKLASSGALRHQKKVSDSLELELQVIANHLTRACLGTAFVSIARAEGSVSH